MRTCLPLMTLALAVPMPAAAQIAAKPIKVKPIQIPRPAPSGPDKTIAVKPLKIAPIVMEKGTLIPVAGRANASAVRARLTATNLRVKAKRPFVMKPMLVKLPGIYRVNGEDSGRLEPGGSYEIAGLGFGTSPQTIILRTSGRAIRLDVQAWSDQVIYASLPADVAGLPDGAAELVVAVAGKAPMTTGKFGFYAAREDVSIPIDNGMFTHVGAGSVKLPVGEVALTSKPTTRSFDGNWYVVDRRADDDDSIGGVNKKCFLPGSDRISRKRQLSPGFEQTGWLFERNAFRNWNSNGESETKRGAWNFRGDDDNIYIDFGVIRHWNDRDASIIFSHGSGYCYANYKIRLIATGPRGMPVTP